MINIHHHGTDRDIFLKTRLLHKTVDLSPVVQPGQGVHGDQRLHILDIEEQQHDRASEAEKGRVERTGLNQAEDDESQRIDPDQPEQAFFVL